MTAYVFSILPVIMNFICLVLCFKFVLSRNGLTWITSLVITVAFMAVSMLLLLAIVTEDTTVEVYSFAFSIAAVNSVISVFWTATILLMRYIITPTERDEMYRRQNLYEIMLKLKKKHPGKVETKEGEVHTETLVQPENTDPEE